MPTYFVEESFVEIDGERLDAFPQFPVPTSEAEQVTGVLTVAGTARVAGSSDDGRYAIALVRLPANARNNSLAQPQLEETIRRAATSGAAGVVAVTEASCASIRVLNAPLDVEPWPVPVLWVGSGNAEALSRAAERQAPATLHLTGRHEEADAFNLIAEIGSEAPDAIVVSTPQSGWFHAAAERGTGVAAFLALARWAAAHADDRRFVFVTTSGHERGNVGAERLLANAFSRPERVRLWLHLGANIGARDDGQPALPSDERYLMVDGSLLASAWGLFRRQRVVGPVPLGLSLAAGELGAYHEAGVRPMAGLFGPGPFHHCANDRLQAVHLEAVADVASAFAALIDATAPRQRPGGAPAQGPGSPAPGPPSP